MASYFTAREYAFWPNPEAPQFGLLLCEDENGSHWALRGGPALFEAARDAENPAAEIARASFEGRWQTREGWPDEWEGERS